MRFADLSPTSSPSRDQQRDALRKGLGRAMQWATTRRLDDDLLLAACLEDQRYDQQLEDSRGDWLWPMIRAVGAADRFRVPILHALYELSDERSANQLCELARCYAEAGDETFRMRLYEIVEQKPFAESGWLGEEEIIRLDGEAGFLFAVRVRGERLSGREWEWDDDGLFHHAGERLGEGRVNEMMKVSDDPAIRAFWEGWQKENGAKNRRGSSTSHRDRMRAITVEEILSSAGSGDSAFGRLRGWGMHADESDLAEVFRHLMTATQASVIAGLLRVFSNRPVPQFVGQLVELCQHPDPEVRRRAIAALEQNEHPLVREFALSRLERGAHEGPAIGLFVKNFRPGDERRILEAIELPDDEDERHGLLMDVIRVLENNPDADPSRLGVIAYASTPCENCRFYSSRLLLARQVAPGWLLEECRHDSGEESRKLVAEIARPTQADIE